MHNSYNRYLAVAARVVRRSLKEQPRLQAEKRGEMDLRFAKWEVSLIPYCIMQRTWGKMRALTLGEMCGSEMHALTVMVV